MFSTMDISRVLLLYAPLPSTDFQCLARGRLVCPGLSRGHLSFRKSVDIWNAALEAVGHYFTKYKRLRPRLQTLVKGKRLRVFVLHIILDAWLYLIRTDACRRRTPTASFLLWPRTRHLVRIAGTTYQSESLHEGSLFYSLFYYFIPYFTRTAGHRPINHSIVVNLFYKLDDYFSSTKLTGLKRLPFFWRSEEFGRTWVVVCAWICAHIIFE